MKTTKRLWPFVLADNKLAEKYLKQQAEKGLLLERIGTYGIFATYRCVEPQERQYCIDGFKGTKEEQGRYIRLAKDAGWDYVTEQPGHIFFVNRDGEIPVPMQTDWREEYLQIRKGLWSQDLPIGIVLVILLLLLGWLWKVLEVGPLPIDGAVLYSYAIFGFILVGFVKAIWFYLKSTIALHRDIPMNLGSMKCAMAWGYARVIFGIGWLIGMFYRSVIPFAKDFRGGINIASFAGGAVIVAVILCVVMGLSVIKTDELGRKVFPTEGRVIIGAGTLYTLLGRFEKEEFIRQVAEENRRKIYIITEKGKGLLNEEFQRLQHLVEDGKKFFEFEGDRKEPPTAGGGGKEEEIRTEVKTTEFKPQIEEKPEEEKPIRLPGRGWHLGGAF